MSKIKPIPLTLGTDPEWMLFDRMKKRYVNAIPVLNHDKHHPLDLGDGFKMYSDNVLVECSIPPARDKAGFIANLMMAIARASNHIGPRYYLSARAAVLYAACELGPKPDKDAIDIPDPWKIGCTPNFDGYTGESNPITAFEDGTRTGSFHLHIGNADYQTGTDLRLIHPASKHNAVKLMDIFVGCAAVIISSDTTAKERRKLYGKAGEFRPTEYGIEYRVLENYFTRQPELVELILDLTVHAMWYLSEGTEASLLEKVDSKLVRKAINNDDMALCEKILEKCNLPFAMCQRITEAQWLGKNLNPAEGWSLTST